MSEKGQENQSLKKKGNRQGNGSIMKETGNSEEQPQKLKHSNSYHRKVRKHNTSIK